MKKTVAIISALLFLVLLVGCGDKSDTSTGGEVQSSNPSEIFDSDGLYVEVERLEYTEGASDIRIMFSIENNTGSVLHTEMSNVVIDGVVVPLEHQFVTADINAGNYSSCYYVAKEKMETCDATNFKNIELTFSISNDNGLNLSKDLSFKREYFVNYE